MKKMYSKALGLVLVLFLFQSIIANISKETVEIVSVFIVSPNEVEVVLTQNLSPESLSLSEGSVIQNAMVLPESTPRAYRIITDNELDYTKVYTVSIGDKTKEARVHWKAIDAKYMYNGELGITYTEQSTEFKLWAPLATEVILNIFKEGTESATSYDNVTMQKRESGVWTTVVERDLYGEFYTYDVTNYGITKEVLDPYAYSKGVDANPGVITGKAAILDPSKIGPKLEYATIEDYDHREDAIIWEIHVRDFTVDPDIETEARFGTYSAFNEKIDYIKKLGVTHVQLLPVMSYGHGNELAAANREMNFKTGVNYNWGYDPHGYFSPDGMYSENPSDPALRIKELKELIHALHAEGLGVTLDVVYNHTSRVSILEDIVPGYYHFMDAQGNTKESYGGGRVGTTHAMVRKLVVDSILFWLEEYKVDGFRFDLMGDLDAETVQIMWDEAVAINPNVHMVGECWRTFAGDDGEDTVPADQDWMDRTNSVACFSDEMRNEVKSGFGSEGERRFITGGARNVDLLYQNVIAKPTNQTEDDPGDILQYLAAHDNLTLHDVIAYSAKLDPATHQQEIQQRIRLGNAMILTSQGVAFLHAGQEYGRTKQWISNSIPENDYTFVEGFEHPYFIHNSYDASDAVNMFDWDKVAEDGIHKETMEYTAGLIALRKSTDAFTHSTEEEVSKYVSKIEAPEIKEEDLILAYSASSSNGEEYMVFINADTSVRTLTLLKEVEGALVIADSDEVSIQGVTTVNGVSISRNQIQIDPLTAVILKVD